MTHWILLSGEYPPTPGGVSDYTRLLACGLAAAGDEVEVWAPRPAPAPAPAPAPEGALTRDAGVGVHELPDRFGPRSLALLGRELAKRPRARLLVQWVPHGLGMRGMNLAFAGWLAARRQPLWVMLHEVAFPLSARGPWKHNVIAVAQRAMAAMVLLRAERTFASIPRWNDYLRTFLPRPPHATWLPIPSNLPTRVPAEAIAGVRASLGLARDDLVVGTFGTYHVTVRDLLAGALVRLLTRDPSRVALLIGRGSVAFAEGSLRGRVAGARVIAVGEQAPDAASAHLAACDAVVQPYTDGVSSRRTSAMAGLALAVPVITNLGHLTESIWRAEGAVALAREPSAEALACAAEAVLTDVSLRAQLGRRGRSLYERCFSLEHVIRTLREGA